jgi:hypothetical protein
MYYSVPPFSDRSHPVKGWGIGIAVSSDLLKWEKCGEIIPVAEYESKGLCAPCAIVRNDTVHLFYQTYGNGKSDAICHAWSLDGISFIRNKTNPVFHPTGKWNCGRAIDAEVIFSEGRYLLYYATRDTAFKTQMLGVAEAPAGTGFNRNDWRNLSTDQSILKPELDWEMECIEGASVIERGGRLFMFYAGAYNNSPQQVGVAVSKDGVNWKRLSKSPFLRNGNPGEWNSSESGHPHIFRDEKNSTWLFYQGNNDRGKSWFISKKEVFWNRKGPYLSKRN